MRENVRMIHNKSTDPVLVKKISVNIWTLRDEVEAVLKKRAEQSSDINIDDLKSEYNQNPAVVYNETDKQADEGEQSDDKAIFQRRPQNIPSEKIYKGKFLLAEIEMDRIYFFSNKDFLPGQSIVLDFLIPNQFTLNADVVYCKAYNIQSRIISNNKLPYRVIAKFTFLRKGERTLLRRFMKSIEPDIEAAPIEEKATEPASSNIDDMDDFDI